MSDGPVVATMAGRLRGVTENGARVFRGIPYAAAAVGDLRWRAPEPVTPWFGVRSAERFGPHALQPRSPMINLDPDDLRVGPSEDCLSLNVFAPDVDAGPLPVMVWIHGGGFTVGSSAQTLYDGGALVRRGGVVVVTINYRLGSLGFLRLTDLTGGRIPSTGNEGLLDQLMALRWVKENIGDFGGDPDNITAFGESAGAMGLAAILGSRASNGLFHRAIIQSGSAHTCHTVDEANWVAQRLLEVAGLSADAEVLSAADGALLTDAVSGLSPQEMRAEGIGWIPLRPVIDGDLLERLPIDGIRNGSADGIPVIAGTTADEWRFMAVPNRPVMTMNDETLHRKLGRVLPDDVMPRAVDLYRRRLSESPQQVAPADIYIAILTDLAFRVPCERMLDAVAHRGAPAYRYLFTWPSPAVHGLLRSCHAVDLGFTFGTNEVDGGEQFFGAGPDADAVVNHMQRAWIAFAGGDDPNDSGQPSWRPYDSDGRATMEIGVEPGLKDDPWRDLRELWDRVPDEVLREF